LRTKSITSCTIAIIGEIIGSVVKSKISDKEFTIDYNRLRVFGLYGLLVTGPVLHWWYGLLEKIVRNMGYIGHTKTLVKLLLDRVIFGPPFVLLTVIFIQYLQNFSIEKTIKYIQNSYFDVLRINETVWTVAQTMNFEVIPVEFQVLFVNAVSIGWNTYLSLAC
jgi:hypothetical protein